MTKRLSSAVTATSRIMKVTKRRVTIASAARPVNIQITASVKEPLLSFWALADIGADILEADLLPLSAKRRQCDGRRGLPINTVCP